MAVHLEPRPLRKSPFSATYGSLPGASLPPLFDVIAPKVRTATAHVLAAEGTVALGPDAGIVPFMLSPRRSLGRRARGSRTARERAT